MSFDDLQFQGFYEHKEQTVYCTSCVENVIVTVTAGRSEESTLCPTCGNRCVPRSANSEGPARGSVPAEMSNLTRLFGQFPVFGSNNLFNEMVLPTLSCTLLTQTLPPCTPYLHPSPCQLRAQENVDVEELMASLLNSEEMNSPPTCKKFLESLQPAPFAP